MLEYGSVHDQVTIDQPFCLYNTTHMLMFISYTYPITSYYQLMMTIVKLYLDLYGSEF